jgi:hypothetical protein
VRKCFHVFSFFSSFNFDVAKEYYSLDGRGNNIDNPTWGAINDTYIRYYDKADYPDGLGNVMSGPDRPTARMITNFFAVNRVARQSPLRLTDFFTFFGEVIYFIIFIY